MPMLDLPRRRRGPRPGQPVGYPVLAADAIKGHLAGAPPEPGGELLTVLREHLVRHAVSLHDLDERPPARPVARVTTLAITHNRDWSSAPEINFELPARRQEHRTHDVELLRLRRRGAFPTPVVLPAPLPSHHRHQAMADQLPIHRRPRRHRPRAPRTLQFEQQPARLPPRMRPAQLTDRHLHRRRHLRRMRMRPIRQPASPAPRYRFNHTCTVLRDTP
jgi:hypothetical protein